MLERYYYWCHSIGLQMYTIPTLILMAVTIIILLCHIRSQNQREQKFEAELQDMVQKITREASRQI